MPFTCWLGVNQMSALHVGGIKAFWDTVTGQVIQTFEGRGTSLVDAVAFSPDGARVLAGSEDSTGEKMGTHLQGPAAPGV